MSSRIEHFKLRRRIAYAQVLILPVYRHEQAPRAPQHRLRDASAVNSAHRASLRRERALKAYLTVLANDPHLRKPVGKPPLYPVKNG